MARVTKNLEWISPNGNTINFNENPFYLEYVGGLGVPSLEIQSEKAPFQDGTTLIDTLLDYRDIMMRIVIFDDNDSEVQGHRRNLVRDFNPKLGVGRLVYNAPYGKTIGIDAIASSSPIFPETGLSEISKRHQIAIVELYCPCPFWKEAEITVSYTDGANIDIDNDADVQTPVELLIEGPATGAKFTNTTTDEEIKMKAAFEVADGEYLYINTAFGKKEITLIKADESRENKLDELDPDSRLFSLAVGNNEVRYDLEAGTGDATLKYQKRYVGV